MPGKTSGAYLQKNGDRLVIRFDRSIRILRNEDRAAVLCGPLVMVQDRRFDIPDSMLLDLDFELAAIPGYCCLRSCSLMICRRNRAV